MREANFALLPPPSGASTPQDEDLRAVARASLEDMKAEDVVEIDLTGKTSIADAMIVASGRSHRHVGAIAERVLEAVKQNGFEPARVEGLPACDWGPIDAGVVTNQSVRLEGR